MIGGIIIFLLIANAWLIVKYVQVIKLVTDMSELLLNSGLMQLKFQDQVYSELDKLKGKP